MGHSRLNLGSVVSLLSATLLVGCGADGPPIRLFEAFGEAVTGGELAPTLESVLKLSGSGAACSASLVAPNLILTAMHCVAPIAIDVDYECEYNGMITQGRTGAGAFTKVADPDEISLQGGPTPGALLAIGARIFTTNSVHICKDDLALVVLDRDLDLPLLPLRLDAATVPDEPMTIVGYGTTGVSGDDVARRERRGVLVEQVGAETAETAVRSAAPLRTFTVGPSACSGDSGGPAIAENSGAVAGLYSIGLNKCTESNALNIYTRLAPFKALILTAFEAAGYEPWFEGEDGPGFPATPPPTASAAPTEPTPSPTSAPSAVPSATSAKPTATTPAPRPTAKPPTSDAGVEEETDEPTAGRRLRSGCSVARSPRPGYTGWLLAAVVAVTTQLRRRRLTSLGQATRRP